MGILINRRFCLFVVVVIIGLTSCGPDEWYHSYVEVSEDGWHKDTVAVFKSEILQLNKSCHVLLEVHNKKVYSYSNIWLFLDAVSPSGYVQRDTLECILANERGDWLGEGNWSDSYISLHPYKLNISFPQKGVYTYYVAQGMRDTILTGIDGVGIKIIEVED